LVLDLTVAVKCAVTTGIDGLPNPALCAKLRSWQVIAATAEQISRQGTLLEVQTATL
jgi:hypothetical protein